MTEREAISQLESLNKEVSIYSDAIDMAISALEKQEQDRWTLCRDRVPELHREVIVTDVETSDTYVAEYCGNGYWNTDTGVEKNRIIAWKNLPEPYKEEEDE